MTNPDRCPCGSNRSYSDCCRRYHDGAFPENALILMRSRYAAYALEKADYIIDTTHPMNPLYQQNRAKWKNEILAFSKNTRFEKLEIVDFTDGSDSATVTFIAHLEQNGLDGSFQEKSRFEKFNGRWLYREKMIEG